MAYGLVRTGDIGALIRPRPESATIRMVSLSPTQQRGESVRVHGLCLDGGRVAFSGLNLRIGAEGREAKGRGEIEIAGAGFNGSLHPGAGAVRFPNVLSLLVLS